MKRIFIVGVGRSGTSLLQSMLNALHQLHSFLRLNFYAIMFGNHFRGRAKILFSKRCGVTKYSADWAFRGFFVQINIRILQYY